MAKGFAELEKRPRRRLKNVLTVALVTLVSK